MNLWHISKTHSKNTPTVCFVFFFFRLKAAITGITFCTGVDHCSCRIIYYECPSWGCNFIIIHYLKLSLSGLLVCSVWKLWPLWKRSDPESHSVDLQTKRPICSALLPCSPKTALNQRVQNSTKTLFMEKEKMLMTRTGYVSQDLLTSTWNERKGKVMYFIFSLSNSFLYRSYFISISKVASRTKNTPPMLSYSLSGPPKLTVGFWTITSKLLLAWHVLQTPSNETILSVIYTTSLTLSPQFSKFGSLIGKFLGPDPGPEPKMITIHLGRWG